MADIPNISAATNDFGNSVVQRAQRNLGATRKVKGKNRRAVFTGNLKDNLDFTLRETSGKQIVYFFARGSAFVYADVVEYGRKKGAKQPPPDAIRNWIKRKPIRLQKPGGGFIRMTDKAINSAAFLIGRAISKNGSPAVRYFRDAVEDELEERGPDFIEAIKKDLSVLFKNRKLV